jgi:hypothetical protein
MNNWCICWFFTHILTKCTIQEAKSPVKNLILIYDISRLRVKFRYNWVGPNKLLLTVKEQRNILHEISKRKAYWIGHILRRNSLLQQVITVKIKERIEVTGRRGSRRRKLLDDLKERRGYSHLKEEALDHTV